MEQTSIEGIGIKEPRSRRIKRLWRPVAATALAFTAAAGIYQLEVSNARSADAEPISAASTLAQGQSNVLELQFMKKAMLINKRDEQIRKEQQELWFDTVIWNNAVRHAARIPYDFALLYGLHNCEQPNSWYASGYNPNDPSHQLFEGGEGMSTPAWIMAVEAAARRGVTLPSSALEASIDQQMEGAQAFIDAYGGGGWSCAPRVGLP